MLGQKELREVVQIGINLATTDRNKLWENMLVTAMNISECDAATLYIYKDNCLYFKIMKTLSLNINKGIDGEVIDLPPVPLREENVCAYSAIHRELINIPDVYISDRFDFSGPKKYDAVTGYRTGSMLVVPLLDAREDLVGVIQLLNKKDANGEFIEFSKDDEFTIKAIGAMTAVTVSNMIYLDEIKDQMYSFVQAFATAIDERTPYNGSHTRKVAEYAVLLANEINLKNSMGQCEDYFDANRLEQLELAAALHDIGKMIVPLSVMNKATRLDEDLPKVINRFELLSVLYERDYLKGKYSKEEFDNIIVYLNDAIEFIKEKDNAGFMPDEALDKMKDIGSRKYIYPDGRELPYLTEEELECMLIRKGTLTAKEREIMESHVVQTKNILDKVHFNSHYSNIVKFASTHHELLDGSGYPNHLKGEALELETRMLAVVDVFDALTCTDRPYKKPIPVPKAIDILYSMVEEGKLEKRLVDYLKDAIDKKTEVES